MPRLAVVEVLATIPSGRWVIASDEEDSPASRSQTAREESAPPDMRLSSRVVSHDARKSKGMRTHYLPSNRSMAMLLTPAAWATSLVLTVLPPAAEVPALLSLC